MIAVGRRPLGKQVAHILDCEVASADEDGIAHFLIDLRGKFPVDIRPPGRWTRRTLASRLVLDVCDEDHTVSLSLHSARGDYLWILTAMHVEHMRAYRRADEHGLLMRVRELARVAIEIELTPTVAVRMLKRGVRTARPRATSARGLDR